MTAQCQYLVLTGPGGFDRGDRWLALGQGAGLVEPHRVDCSHRFQGEPVLDQDAAAGCPFGGDRHHQRDGEAEGVGAGNDQHGDGTDDGLVGQSQQHPHDHSDDAGAQGELHSSATHTEQRKTSGSTSQAKRSEDLLILKPRSGERCANFASKAVAAGLAERTVRIAERQGQLMVEMVQRLRSGRWVRDRLDEFLWSKQRGIAKSIVRNRYTVIKSSRDTGKSFTAARMAVLARGARELIGPLWPGRHTACRSTRVRRPIGVC